MPGLFDTLSLRGVTLRNRIAVSPMCQYSASDGCANDWHFVHLASRAVGGAGLVIAEASAVTPAGRISPQDLGLWSDAHVEPLARIVRVIDGEGAVAGIQLAHAGRKASTLRPWDGNGTVPASAGGWSDVVGPSAVPFDDTSITPHALSIDDIAVVVGAFAAAARRALAAGFRVVELHAAHGYLLHQFLSPLANRRDDAYGGSLENRMRFPLEVFDAVRDAFPAERPVWARISATDWVPEGWDIEGTVALSMALKARGCAAIHVSSGGVSPRQVIKLGPGYQVPYAQRVKADVGLPTIAVGLITEPEQAEAIIVNGEADAVSLARAMLYDPRWPWHAAAKLGARVEAPKQYWRSQPREFKDLFENAAFGAR